MRRLLDVVAALLLIGGLGCDEDNPFRTITPDVSAGESQVWELALPGFPSAWDFPTAQRLFIGTDGFGSSLGSWVLDARADGTLILRPFSSLVEISLARTGIQDLGPVDFDSVIEAPQDGYSAVEDSTGVPVVEGHVYAFRISRLSSGVIPINYAKLRITEAGTEFPDDPQSRFVRFEWAYQSQPLNRRLVEEEG
ncbi:MAG: hypothetical protein ACREMD_12975 [Gemmatimonadota bacterium]